MCVYAAFLVILLVTGNARGAGGVGVDGDDKEEVIYSDTSANE